MMKRAFVLFALVLACKSEPPPPVPAGPVEWSVSAEVDKREVQVGEDLTLTLTLRHPEGGQYAAPPRAGFAPFDVISSSEESVSPTETRLLFRLAAFRLPEELEIPALTVNYRDESGELRPLETGAIPIRVVTSLTPDVTDIHDIKEPLDLEVPRDLSLLWWLLAAALAALVAYLIYRKLRKDPEALAAASFTPPPPPADVEAEAALRRLKERKLIEAGELILFYTELAEILKRYAGRRFDVPYLERTTHEVLTDLRPRKVAPHVLANLRAILEASDLVKFAKLMPERNQAEKSLDLAFRLVDETRIPLEATA
jgi:hypothetical protein